MNRYKIIMYTNNVFMFALGVIAMVFVLRFALSTDVIVNYRLSGQYAEANWFILKNILTIVTVSAIIYGIACLNEAIKELYCETSTAKADTKDSIA